MNLEEIKKTLKNNGLRITQTRLRVANILLNNNNSYLTPEEVFKNIDGGECDQVTVYRVLSKFETLGIVSKSSFKGEANRFKLASENKSVHGHFFKCNQCNVIEPLNECFVIQKEKELKANGYKNLSHHLEITGLCPTCA